jgi:type I restriction enzyme S subunit
MELKPGFKQTEVGIIPEDWEVREVREFARVITGPFGTLLKASEYSESDGVPLISVGEIGDGYFRIGQHTPRIPSKVVNRLPQYLLRAGDVVFGRKGAVDRSALVSDREHGWFLGSDGISIRPTSNCHSPYLAAQFRGASAKAWLVQNATGTTMASLNQRVLSRAKIPIASLPEQSAIATALSDVDALLSGLDKLIAKKHDLKQAAMQQLLTGETRLPGFDGKWQVKRLDQLANIRSGGTPSTSVARFWDGEIPWCTPTDITQLNGSKYLVQTSRTITQDGLLNSSAELIPANSVVMTSRATIGECAINSVPVTTNQGFKNFVPFEATDVEFLYYLLQTQKQGFVRLCAGSTFLEIGKTQLAAYEVQLPTTKEEQSAIAEVLSDMDAELAALEARRDKSHLLKQGMMQELLTGKTRLV